MYPFHVADQVEVARLGTTYIYDLVITKGVVAVISSDDSLRLFNASRLGDSGVQQFQNIHDGITCLNSLSSDGNMYCTAGRDGEVKIYDMRLGDVTARFCVGT